MLVFRLEEMVLIMFVDSSVVADFHFFRELSSTLLAVLPVVAKSLSDKLVRQSVGSEDSYKYVYFNHMNLACKTSLYMPRNGISRELMCVVEELHSAFQNHLQRQPGTENLETCVKTQEESWILGRLVANREFYAIFDRRNMSVVDATASLRALTKVFFSTAFQD